MRLILEAVVARTVEEGLRESLTEEEDRLTRSEREREERVNIQIQTLLTGEFSRLTRMKCYH